MSKKGYPKGMGLGDWGVRVWEALVFFVLYALLCCFQGEWVFTKKT